MIVNGKALLDAAPIVDMWPNKQVEHGVSFGLGEAGYDIRIKQTITFTKTDSNQRIVLSDSPDDYRVVTDGRFTLASAMEEFQMPNDLMGIVHDKSTWARRGLSVFNTVIEPGWHGFLTLELVYHGEGELIIPAGAGIAQVVFHMVEEPRAYTGKYQNQPDEPVPARASDGYQ